MNISQQRFSSRVSLILDKYPQWHSKVIKSINKPPLDKDYCPQILEVFDQNGLLAGIVRGYSSYESMRNVEQNSEFNAWLLDEELVVFYVGAELVINRLQLLQGCVW
ncbi:MAG: hypothetical protein ACFB02_22660 [Mastigocoleus sp.]